MKFCDPDSSAAKGICDYAAFAAMRETGVGLGWVAGAKKRAKSTVVGAQLCFRDAILLLLPSVC